jgi:hypothetical protein
MVLEKCHVEDVVICISHQMLLGWANQGGWNGQGIKKKMLVK